MGWTSQGSLKGPQGAQGAQGVQGAAGGGGAQGPQGNQGAGGAALPAGITGTGTYDPQAHVYTPVGANSPFKLKSKLAGAIAGTNRCRIAVLGASNISGWDGSTSHRGSNEWVTLLHNSLKASGYPMTEGPITFMDGVAGDARITVLSGTWAYNPSGATASATKYLAGSTGAVIGVTMRDSVDTISVKLSALATSTHTIRVDGAVVTSFSSLVHAANAAGAVTTDGSNNAAVITFAVAPGIHTVTVTANGLFYPMEIAGYNAVAGVEVANYGSSGTTSTQWADTSVWYTLLNRVISAAPDVAIVDCGIFANDFGATSPVVTPAQMLANGNTIIAALKAAGIEVILNGIPAFVSPTNGTPTATFWQTLFSLADAQGVMFIDHWTALGTTRAVSVTNGLAGTDTVHQSTAGMAAVAHNIVAALEIEPMAAPTALPAGISGAGYYDTKTNVYIPPNSIGSFRLKSLLAQVDVLTGQSVRIGCIGASNTAGYNGVGSLRGIGLSWPEQLREAIEALGYPVGDGSARLNDMVCFDARVTLTGTWGNSGGAAAYVYGYTLQIGATATFTSVKHGTIAEAEITATSGAQSLAVDGVAPANGNVAVTNGTYAGGVVTPSGASAICKITVTGLQDTTHVMVLTNNTATGMTLISMDVKPTISIDIANFGVSGAQTAYWNNVTTYYTLLNELIAYAPHVVIFDTGPAFNDWNNSLTLASTLANMQATITTLQNLGIEVILNGVTPALGTIGGNNGVAPPGAFWQNFFALADATGCLYVHNYRRWGESEPAARANGLVNTTDTVHPTAAGYQDLVQSLVQALGLVAVPKPTQHKVYIANSGTAIAIPATVMNNDAVITLTGAAPVITMPTPVAGGRITLALKQDATGSRVPSWSANVKWPAGNVPVLTTTAGKVDWITFISPDGVNWHGFLAGLNY